MAEMTYFCVYNDWLNTLKLYNDEQAGRLLLAAIRYNCTGEEPEFEGPEKFFFEHIKWTIDNSKRNYAEKCEKNSRNGAKGGRPRKSKKSENKPDFCSEKPNGLKKSQYKDEYEYKDKDEYKDEEKENAREVSETANFENPRFSCSPVGSHSPAPETEEDSDTETDACLTTTDALPETQTTADGEETEVFGVREAVEAYTRLCPSLPRVRGISKKRRRALKELLRTTSRETFETVLRKAEASPFLRGKNKRNWVATFDFIISEDSFFKILEGNYDACPTSAHSQTPGAHLDLNATLDCDPATSDPFAVSLAIVRRELAEAGIHVPEECGSQ